MDKDLTQLTEKKLVALSKKGDCFAFEELLKRNRDIVFSTIIRRLTTVRLPHINRGSLDEEDIFSISSFKAWKNIKKFKGDCKFSTWLTRISINEITDETRKNLRKHATSLDCLIEATGDKAAFQSCEQSNNQAVNNLLHKDIRKIYEKALTKLSPTQRMAIHLFVDDGLSYEEISKACCVPIGTIMSRLFYSRKKLRKEIELLLNK